MKRVSISGRVALAATLLAVTIPAGVGSAAAEESPPVAQVRPTYYKELDKPRFRTVVLSITHKTKVPVVITWETIGGTASTGIDYIPTSGIATIPPGRQVARVKVKVVGDREPEPNESFGVRITAVTGAELGLSSDGWVALFDDD